MPDQLSHAEVLGRYVCAATSAQPRPAWFTGEKQSKLAPSPSTERGELSQTAGGEVGDGLRLTKPISLGQSVSMRGFAPYA